MALCEKQTKYEKVIKERVGFPGYSKILNLMYSADTGQLTLQLCHDDGQRNGYGSKGKPMACVLPEELNKEVKDYLLSLAYPHFEANLVELSIYEKISEELSDLEIDYSSIEKEAEASTLSIQVEARKAKKALESEKDDRKAILSEKEIDSKLSKDLEDLRNDLEEKKKAIKDKEEGKIKTKYNKKIKQVKKDYGIA